MDLDITYLPAFEGLYLPAADAVVNKLGADAAPNTKHIMFHYRLFNEWLYVHYRPKHFEQYYTVAMFLRFYEECLPHMGNEDYSYLQTRNNRPQKPYYMEAVPIPLDKAPVRFIHVEEVEEETQKQEPAAHHGPPLVWRGNQKQLAELLITLVDKGWLEPAPPGGLSQFCRTICSVFDLSHTQRSQNSDIEKSFYQIMKPDVDMATKKTTYPKVYAKNTVPSFSKIIPNKRR